MFIKFNSPDPRAGTTAQVGDDRGQQFIDAGLATKVEDPKPTPAPSPAPEYKDAPGVTRMPMNDGRGAMPSAEDLQRGVDRRAERRAEGVSRAGNTANAGTGAEGTRTEADGSPVVTARKAASAPAPSPAPSAAPAADGTK